MHLYADTNNGKTPGIIRNHMGGGSDASFFSAILPYIDGGSFHRAYLAPSSNRGVKIFLCPADPTYDAHSGNFIPISYAANAQAFLLGRRLVADFRDGTSHTIAFAEHYSNCSGTVFDYGMSWSWYPPFHRATFAEGGPDLLYPGAGPDAYPIVRPTGTVPSIKGAMFQVRPNPTNECFSAVPQTGHLGGMVTANVDGSVRVLPASMALSVFWGSVTPNGGEVLAD